VTQLFSDPSFWVTVSFIIFILLAARPVSRKIATALDARSEQIRRELDEAVRLREEAQAILASYQKKQRESMAEAERILQQTREDAQAMAEKAEADLKSSIEKRKKLAMEKIEQAEKQAMQAVQSHVVDIAVSAARAVISEQMASGKTDDLMKLATSNIERKLH
jgi:F-type H+-transporting ATPase subunit b